MSSHPPILTHKNHTDQQHGLDKSWENFIYFPSPSVGFFHLYVYLFAFFRGGGGRAVWAKIVTSLNICWVSEVSVNIK